MSIWNNAHALIDFQAFLDILSIIIDSHININDFRCFDH